MKTFKFGRLPGGAGTTPLRVRYTLDIESDRFADACRALQLAVTDACPGGNVPGPAMKYERVNQWHGQAFACVVYIDEGVLVASATQLPF